MNIKLIDLIGDHAGMHYYLESFEEILHGCGGHQITVLSNFPAGKAFFKNQYRGNILQKISKLIWNLLAFRRHLRRHSDDYFIYLSYGTYLDPLFIIPLTRMKLHCVDVHEAIDQDAENRKIQRRVFAFLYSKRIKNVISHSARTDSLLKDFGFGGTVYHVPHFKYIFRKTFDSSNLGCPVETVFNKEKINLLFFGSIRYNKGIDILIREVDNLPSEYRDRLNVIIAGKDCDGAYRSVAISHPECFNFIIRHINDDELVYMYRNSDYIALPYRITSQSGILEMAFYFKVPVITSGLPYFEFTLRTFPSFGVVADPNTESYGECLKRVMDSHTEKHYFSDEDYSRYEHRDELEIFKSEFSRQFAG